MSKALRCVAVVAAAGLLSAVPAAPGTGVTAPADAAAVIVQAPGAQTQAAAAVDRLGGTVTAELPIVDGFAATVPSTAVDLLAAVPGVTAVTPDATMHPAAKPGG
ncbi:MAG TPA: hypothetical protein VM307_15410, partial [Egibacteraceae bacterium]|nr:hypothetical protein [Egibacteraceae bacterium]